MSCCSVAWHSEKQCLPPKLHCLSHASTKYTVLKVQETKSIGSCSMRSDLQVFLQILPFTGQQPFNNQENGAAGGGRARALYSFASTCDEELSLRVLMWFHLTWVNNKFLITCKTTFPLLLQVGDIVTNLESIDDEWFLGDLRGKRALVPKNYVQVLD